MDQPLTYRFPSTEKLKSRKLIDELFSSGKSFSLSPFRVLWLPMHVDAQTLQVGFTVSAKRFPKAVDRNRIKRLMREAWRMQKAPLLAKLDSEGKRFLFFLIYTGNDVPPFKTVQEKTGKLILRLIQLTDEDPVADT